jgi:S-adenosylmethionine:tRNA ribosyltransferase-isomerase
LLEAKVIEKLGGAKYRVQFQDPDAVELFGALPLPPYIKTTLDDPSRYQTIYAQEQGSLAAPTAGLHFTETLMQKLKNQGVDFAALTLHVGIGTFAPIRTEKVEDWQMHSEYYKVSKETAEKINQAIQEKKRIFAVGTTSVRTLETITKTMDSSWSQPLTPIEGWNDTKARVEAKEGWTNIFIYPGYHFKFPYAGLLTNFHLPKSTLILLASAFAGKEKLFRAYQEAVEKQYRFYSLGDAMLILKDGYEM